MTDLPEAFTTRPAARADLNALVDLINACSQALIGRPRVEEADLRNEWNSPTFHLATDTQVVCDPEGQLAGYVEVWDNPPHVKLWIWGRVHPAYQERGIGSYLLEWGEARARQSIPKAPEGARVTVQQEAMSTHRTARRLLKAHGYREVRHFLRMVVELDAPPPDPQFPEGIRVRTFRRDQDLPAVVRADQDAFRDHWGYVARPFEITLANWTQWIDDNPDFDPDLWYLAMDGDEIAGLCLCDRKLVEDPEMGWVSTLCVRRPWRRQGIALALLHHCFGEFYRRGQRRVGLGVDADSLTGATRLYEKAGMHAAREFVTYEKELRSGEDLSTQRLEG